MSGLTFSDSETVSMTFQWPNTLCGTVSDAHIEAVSTATTVNTVELAVSYKLKGSRTTTGYRLDNDTTSPSISVKQAGLNVSLLNDLVSAAVTRFPTVLINNLGEISAPNLEKNSADTVTELTSRYRDQIQERHAIESVFSPNQIDQSMKNQWYRMVQMWNGVDLKLGMWYQAQGSDYIPFLQQTIPSDYYFRVLAKVSCPGTFNRRDCILIEGKSVSKLIENELITAVTDGDPKDSKVATYFSIITDPKTLLPYFYQESREGMFGTTHVMTLSRIQYNYETVN